MKDIDTYPKVSVIIPFYNMQDFIQICIESVLNQTYDNFEIICIDDGSIDESVEIVKKLMLLDDRIKLIQSKNQGQGYQRNFALSLAEGKYIMFLDSDDYIEPVTLKNTVTRAEEDDSDFVVFDWRYYNIGSKDRYVNCDSFFSKPHLKGKECTELLKVSPIFSVNKLYRKSYLIDNGIKFMEGYIYEDNPFWVKTVMSAKIVSLIHAPLYRVTISNNSSTKSNYESDWHSVSFIKAIQDIIDTVKNNGVYDDNICYLYVYILQKFISYYSIRVPREYRKSFLENFIDEFSRIDEFPDLKISKLYTFCIKYNVFSAKKSKLFYLCVQYITLVKPKIQKHKNKVLKRIKESKGKVKRIWYHKKSSTRKNYSFFLRQTIYNDTIVFMGFDYRYTGNSRYLFEEMLRKNIDKKLFFVTNDPQVPLQYRIKPNSERMERFIARSKVTIFESWIPGNYKKRNDSIWIQLWHGTPIKKLLFDSHEKFITTNNKENKIQKYNDIARWDWLIVDNGNVSHFFESAFLFKKEKILHSGYPRVKYLLSKKEDSNYIAKLKKNVGISDDKKIVLYMPTWRDYNYKKEPEEWDLDYIINLKELQILLGNQYEIIYKDHPFLSTSDEVLFKNYSEIETQELLLMADYLITDYSSIVFDAFAIDLPIILYCTDIEKNEEARGVYKEVWSDLKKYLCTKLVDVIEMINDYKIDKDYCYIKERYAYKEDVDKELATFILNL